MKQISLIGVGGTIASLPGDDGAQPQLTAEAIAAAVPGLVDAAKLSARTFRALPSLAMQFADVFDLLSEIQTELDTGAEGVVITQGTDTLEETAFALDLLYSGSDPLVITGAMRHPGLAGPDGPANVLSAVRVAASEAARGVGALVVMNDQVHAARYVQKTHTTNVATFASRNVGPLGWVSEGDVRILVKPAERVKFDAPSHDGSSPAVALMKASLGDDGRLLDALPDLGYSGTVIEGFGGGHVSPPMAERVSALIEHMPVVVTSRTGSGETLRSTYGSPGSERDLLRRGVIGGGMLDGLKSRVLLTLLLMQGRSRDEIRGQFDAFATS